jgi:uncharacterized protein (DUF697 family)
MDKFEQNIQLYIGTFTDVLGRDDLDLNLLKSITTYLGPSIYNADSAKVACSKKEEREAVKKSFLIKKLKLKDSQALDDAILEVCRTMGSSNRNKWRPVFYYLLVEKFEKQHLFEPIVSIPADEKDFTSGTVNTIEDYQSKSTMDTEETIKKPEDIVGTYAVYAAGAGFIPIPIIDLMSISTIQYKMIQKLAAKYPHVTFEDKRAKSIIAALMGGLSAFEFRLLTRMIFKRVPLFGLLVGGTAMSAFAYASTRVVGDIFEQHFGTGGDLSIEDITLQKMKDSFKFKMSNSK